MPTLQIEIEEGGDAHRSLRAIIALNPGLTLTGVVEAAVDSSFKEAIADLSLIDAYANVAVMYRDATRKREDKRCRALEKARQLVRLREKKSLPRSRPALKMRPLPKAA